MGRLKDWLDSLVANGALVKNDEIRPSNGSAAYTLSRPIRICISEIAADRLRKRYRNDREIGESYLQNLLSRMVRRMSSLSQEEFDSSGIFQMKLKGSIYPEETVLII